MKKSNILLLALINASIFCGDNKDKEHSLTPFPNPLSAQIGSLIVEISGNQPSHSNSDLDFTKFARGSRDNSLVYMQPEGEEGKEGMTRPTGLSIEVEGSPTELSTASSGESQNDVPPSPLNNKTYQRSPSSGKGGQAGMIAHAMNQPNQGLTQSLSAGTIEAALRGKGGITSPRVPSPRAKEQSPRHQRSQTTSFQNDSQSNCHNLATDEGVRPSDMYPRPSVTNSTSQQNEVSNSSTLSYPPVNDPNNATTPTRRKHPAANETVTSETVRADLAPKRPQKPESPRPFNTESPTGKVAMKQAQKKRKNWCTECCSYLASWLSREQK